MGDTVEATQVDRMPALLAGGVAGALVASWLAFGALVWGDAAWFPFSPGILIDRLELVWRGLPAEVLAGPGMEIYVGVPIVLALASFVWFWVQVCRDGAQLAVDVAVHEARQRHADQIANAEAAWEALEQAEPTASADEQLRLARESVRSLVLAEALAPDWRNRVRRCRQMAREHSSSDPKLALEILQIARRALREGRAAVPTVEGCFVADLGVFVGTATALVVTVPLVVLAVAWVCGLVVFVLRLVLAILVVLAILAVLAGAGKK